MAHKKFTVEHYKEELDYYKSELECNVLAEMSFEEFESEPEVLRKSDSDSIIEYVVRNYNLVNISDSLERYINYERFIEALGTEKESFADKLRKMVMEEYHNQRDHWIEELIKYINSPDSTIEEKETAKLLIEDCSSLLIYLNNAYNLWLDKKYDRGSVMRLITNPDKLKSFITENTALLDVLTKTILENVDGTENKKECSEDGLLVDATI